VKSKVNVRQVKKSILLSVGAQVVSLLVSVLLNLIVPKYISEYQYAYWQTYLLYISYVGILHFGLLDGIVLRYSQYDYDELEKPRIRSQFIVLLVVTSCITIISMLIANIFYNGIARDIIILVAIGIITRNLFTYTSYTFQITNRISKYALLIISQRVLFGIGVGALLILGVRDYYWFCIVDLCCDAFGCLLGARFNRGLYFGKLIGFKQVIKETWSNVSSGILLLVANWSSMLLVGSAKMIIQWRWDQLVFGKISFAFSLSNLFLTFVTAISVVLFPSLKRMRVEELPSVYRGIRNAVSPILLFTMILYFPGCWILEKWIPVYQPSLVYLGILLPIIIYTSNVSLLTNNYLKAYRKEKSMFFVNLISIGIAFLLYTLCAYVLESVTMVLLSVVFVIMLRSILSEIVVMKLISSYFYTDFIIEGVMTVIFILCARMFSLQTGCLIYICALIIYAYVYRRNIKEMTAKIFSKVKSRRA
jgi:O-antigen/teichoic acid export membrane protein